MLVSYYPESNQGLKSWWKEAWGEYPQEHLFVAFLNGSRVILAIFKSWKIAYIYIYIYIYIY